MSFTNSSLVSYKKLSPATNYYGKRNQKIDRITPHCAVGQISIESLANIFFNPARGASSNYGIGSDGRIGMFVEEKNASGCSSSESNDRRAITIECACDLTHPYAFKNIVYEKLIELCVDICKRNGKTKLLWISDKNKALSYKLASNEMLLTAHRWFSATACPGDWMYGKMKDLADKVTSKLNSNTTNVIVQRNVKINGINVARFTDDIILYTGKAKTGTNKWGTEVALDANGIAISNPEKYVGNMTIPLNGYVISGHGKGSDWIANNIKKGMKIKFDIQAVIN